MFKTTKRAFSAGVVALLTTAMVPSLATADGVSFEGETIDFVNFGAPGSPPDVWIRTLAPFVSKHLAGNPKINMINKPGAGSMISANYTAKALKNDGLAIGTMNAVAMNKAAQGDSSAQFDLSELEIVGAQKLTRMVAVRKDGLSSVEDLLASDEVLVMGMESDARPYYAGFFDAAGVDSKIIASYQRFPDTMQAFRSGEVDAMPMSLIEWNTFGPDLMKNGAFAAFQVGLSDGGDIVASGALDVPTGHALVEQTNPEAKGSDGWNAMTVVAAGQTISNQIWAPAGTPQDYVEALAQAFVDATSDPEFMALHVEQYGLPVEWTGREEARSVVDAVIATYAN